MARLGNEPCSYDARDLVLSEASSAARNLSSSGIGDRQRRFDAQHLRVDVSAGDQDPAPEERLGDGVTELVARGTPCRASVPRPRAPAMTFGYFSASVVQRGRRYSPFSPACFGRSSSSSTLIVAIAAAQQTGLPPNVVVWRNGLSMYFSHVFGGSDAGADRHHAAAEALPERHEIRHDAVVLAAEHLAAAAHAALDLVEDQHRAVLVADLAGRGEIARRRHVDPAFALDRLDHDGGHAVAREVAARHDHAQRVDVTERHVGPGLSGRNGSRNIAFDVPPSEPRDLPWNAPIVPTK